MLLVSLFTLAGNGIVVSEGSTSFLKEYESANVVFHWDQGTWDITRPLTDHWGSEFERMTSVAERFFVDGFNEIVDGFEQYNQDFLIEFEKCEDEADGHKLLGHPADWQYQETTEQLLFQLDPMACEKMNLFPTFDGFLYFFFGDDLNDFSKVTLVEDIS